MTQSLSSSPFVAGPMKDHVLCGFSPAEMDRVCCEFWFVVLPDLKGGLHTFEC